MDTITPYRHTITERFPIASFGVRVPEARHYEVACATDPKLFHTDYSAQRTSNNFYTSRSHGLKYANPGENNWMIPSEQLKRFAGASKLYYALGTYAGKNNENPRFTITPDALDKIPSISLSPDFTGRNLDRARLGIKQTMNNTYGAVQTSGQIRWGGDIAFEMEKQLHQAESDHVATDYDDGYDSSLWLQSSGYTAFDEDYATDANQNTVESNKTSNNITELEDGADFNHFQSDDVIPINQNQSVTSHHNGNQAGVIGHPQILKYGRRYQPTSYPTASNLSHQEDQLIQEIVSSGVNESEVRHFAEQIKRTDTIVQPQALTRPSTATGTRISLPGGHTLSDWQADYALCAAQRALASFPVLNAMGTNIPTVLLHLCNRLNICIGIGPALSGGLVAGASFGVGVLFAPGNRIGFYGSVSGMLGWVGSVSGSLQLTVINGGPSNFGGEAIAVGGTVDLSEGPGLGVHYLSNVNGAPLGVTAEISISIGVPVLSAIEVFAQYQHTETTLALQKQAARATNNLPTNQQNGLHASQNHDVTEYEDGADYHVSNNKHATPSAAEQFTIQGKAATYHEEIQEESLPIGPAAHPLSARELDIPEKVRIIRIVSKAENNDESYAAVSTSEEINNAELLSKTGLTWGIVRFTQRSGLLGKVLRKAREREIALTAPNTPEPGLPDEHRFATLFGEDWQQLLSITDPDITTDPEERLSPISGKPLWDEPWLSRFRNAGSVPYIQAAQNEVAVTEYVDKIIPIARWLGLNTARGLAVLLDRVIHAGIGGGLSWIMKAIGPIRSQADQQTALNAVGGPNHTLADFQRQNNIDATGEWNAITHAALTAALRTLGQSSPITISTPEDMLQSLIIQAKGTPFEERLVALFQNRQDFNDNITYELS